MSSTPVFNLLHEPWIPVLYHTGNWKKVGVLQALKDAGEIRHLAASNPMDRVAVLRFLLALLYWGGGKPSGEIPKSLFDKLSRHEENFNLLGDGKRFYQVPGTNRERPTTDLLQEIPTGNNFWHFRHSTDYVEGLCPSCCAFGLLRLPLFSVSGLGNLKVGINGTPPIYMVPVGDSLLQTLQLNLLGNQPLGHASFETPCFSASQDEKVPILTGLTILSRKVWLQSPVSSSGGCISCGDRSVQVIIKCNFEPAGQQQSELWNDPHAVYIKGKSGRRSLCATDLTKAKKFELDRPWTDLIAALLRSEFSIGLARRLHVVGFATDNAKNVDVWERSIELPEQQEFTEPALAMTGLWVSEALDFRRKVNWRKPSETKRKLIEIKATVTLIRPHVEHVVSSRVEELMSGSIEAWTTAADEYKIMMKGVSESLSPGATIQQLSRRRLVANAAPSMEPKAKQTEKTKPKKGAKK